MESNKKDKPIFGIFINILHIIFISTVLIILANNLNDDAKGLRDTTYFVVGIMIIYHLYKVSTKFGMNHDLYPINE